MPHPCSLEPRPESNTLKILPLNRARKVPRTIYQDPTSRAKTPTSYG